MKLVIVVKWTLQRREVFGELCLVVPTHTVDSRWMRRFTQSRNEFP